MVLCIYELITGDLETPCSHQKCSVMKITKLNTEMNMQKMLPGKIYNIQSLRGIAAFLVLLSHLYTMEKNIWGDQILSSAFRMGMSGVDLFFVISGFIMVYVTRNWNGGELYRIREFLFARITRIYPLYWFVSLITLALYFLNRKLFLA